MRLAAFAIVIVGRASGQESENTEPFSLASLHLLSLPPS